LWPLVSVDVDVELVPLLEEVFAHGSGSGPFAHGSGSGPQVSQLFTKLVCSVTFVGSTGCGVCCASAARFSASERSAD
jgi:hypothetical protein